MCFCLSYCSLRKEKSPSLLLKGQEGELCSFSLSSSWQLPRCAQLYTHQPEGPVSFSRPALSWIQVICGRKNQKDKKPTALLTLQNANIQFSWKNLKSLSGMWAVVTFSWSQPTLFAPNLPNQMVQSNSNSESEHPSLQALTTPARRNQQARARKQHAWRPCTAQHEALGSSRPSIKPGSRSLGN